MDPLKDTTTKKGITKNILIIVAIVVVLGVAYVLFFKKGNTTQNTGGLSTASDSPVNTSGGPVVSDVQVTSQQFLAQLLNIDSIKIDNAIVTNPAFVVLKDLSKPIDPDNNPGRINPFAPLGSESATVSTQINTNDPTLKLATSAVLNGTLLVSGQGITRWFEYGTTDSLGTKTTETPQSTTGVFSESITNLIPNTTYYVKAIASINGQIISGAFMSWKTGALKRSGK
ncbi:MAG: hypothetical protein WCO65_00455 [bacterium]